MALTININAAYWETSPAVHLFQKREARARASTLTFPRHLECCWVFPRGSEEKIKNTIMTQTTILAEHRYYADEDPFLLGRGGEKQKHQNHDGSKNRDGSKNSKSCHAGGSEVDDTLLQQSEHLNPSPRSSPCLPLWAIVLIAFLTTAGVFIVAVNKNHARSTSSGTEGNNVAPTPPPTAGGGNDGVGGSSVGTSGGGAFTERASATTLTQINATRYYGYRERTNGQTVRQIVANLRGILSANTTAAGHQSQSNPRPASVVYLAGDSWVDGSRFLETRGWMSKQRCLDGLFPKNADGSRFQKTGTKSIHPDRWMVGWACFQKTGTGWMDGWACFQKTGKDWTGWLALFGWMDSWMDGWLAFFLENDSSCWCVRCMLLVCEMCRFNACASCWCVRVSKSSDARTDCSCSEHFRDVLGMLEELGTLAGVNRAD
ncbi:unnamed protein product [Amoebophrya sp. A120]|nr:unnamed protein product [Amoebophrya sp. A120]|eukprot:GSA120T00014052001.1